MLRVLTWHVFSVYFAKQVMKSASVNTSGPGTVISFRLDKEKAARLRAIADADDRTVSYIARLFVLRGLDSENEEKAA